MCFFLQGGWALLWRSSVGWEELGVQRNVLLSLQLQLTVISVFKVSNNTQQTHKRNRMRVFLHWEHASRVCSYATEWEAGGVCLTRLQKSDNCTQHLLNALRLQKPDESATESRWRRWMLEGFRPEVLCRRAQSPCSLHHFYLPPLLQSNHTLFICVFLTVLLSWLIAAFPPPSSQSWKIKHLFLIISSSRTNIHSALLCINSKDTETWFYEVQEKIF